MTKQMTAIGHIADQGMKSRTTKFNATMGAVSTFAVPMLSLVPEAHDWANVAVPSTLTFATAIGNVWLYGATHVKHRVSRN